MWGISVAAFIAIFAVKLPFPLIVLAAGVIGYFGGRMAPKVFATGGGHGAANTHYGVALIDDNTPTPPHALFNKAHLLRMTLIFLALWAAGLAMLFAAYGWQATLTQIGWFFTKAALLTFGGAYAVLPYVYQASVEHYQWLTPVQMIDGLALGETTPGPLIMIVAFVGFVAAWTQQVFGADALLLAGSVGAAVATFFTFLPSFLFILAGGPFIETTHGNLKFTAPLTAITAAVVGVIVNLAAFFAWHVFWPAGFDGRTEWFAMLISIVAFVALLRYKAGVVSVIAACGVAGLAYQLL
jgi:chromate transporter